MSVNRRRTRGLSLANDSSVRRLLEKNNASMGRRRLSAVDLGENGPKEGTHEIPTDVNKLLIYAVENDRIDLLEKALDEGVDVNVPFSETGQNALHIAISTDKCGMFELLLQHGADPHLEDSKFRDCFYFACFGANIKNHKQYIYRLLEHDGDKGRPLSSKLMLTAAYASNNEEVTEILLNSLQYKVLSKDSHGASKFRFWGLDMLDNPCVRVRWPDGSYSSEGTTAIHVLVSKGKGKLLMHPTLLAIMDWKWKQYAGKEFLKECVVYFLQLSCTILLCIMCNKEWLMESNGTGSLNDYNWSEPWSNIRFGLEVFVLVIMIAAVKILSQDYGGSFPLKFWGKPEQKSKFTQSAWQIAIPVVTQVCIFTVFVLRILRATNTGQLVLIALASILCWERFISYMSLRPSVGPFYIMLVEMFKRDLAPFALVLIAIILAFSSTLSLLVSNLNSDEPSAILYSSFRHSAVELMFGFVGTDSFNAVRAAWANSENATENMYMLILLVTFTVIGPILALNLLLAMMTNTYQEINTNSVAEWALRRFRYICLRENTCKNPHFGFISTASGSTCPRSVSPNTEGSAAKYAQDQGSNCAYTRCLNLCTAGLYIETYHDTLFKPYSVQSKTNETAQLRELLVEVLLQLETIKAQNPNMQL